MPYGNDSAGPTIWHDWLAENIPLARIREFVDFLVEDMGDSKARPRLRDLKRTRRMRLKDLQEGDAFGFIQATFCYACGGYDVDGSEKNAGWLSHLCRNQRNGKIVELVVPCMCEVGQELERRSKVPCNKKLQEDIYNIKAEEGRRMEEQRKPIQNKEVQRGMMRDINQIVDKKMTRREYAEKWGC